MRNSKAASDIDRQIAARIRLARLESGMSQEKLAEALGITFQQVQKYEKGLNRNLKALTPETRRAVDALLSSLSGSGEAAK